MNKGWRQIIVIKSFCCHQRSLFLSKIYSFPKLTHKSPNYTNYKTTLLRFQYRKAELIPCDLVKTADAWLDNTHLEVTVYYKGLHPELSVKRHWRLWLKAQNGKMVHTSPWSANFKAYLVWFKTGWVVFVRDRCTSCQLTSCQLTSCQLVSWTKIYEHTMIFLLVLHRHNINAQANMFHEKETYQHLLDERTIINTFLLIN